MLCLTYTAKVQNQHRNEQTFRHSNSYACRSNRKKNHKKKCKNPRTCFGGHVYQKDGLFIHFLFAEQPLDFLIHYSLLDSFYNSAKTSQ